MLLELGFKTLEQGESVGGAAGESRQHRVLVQGANLARVALEYGVGQAHLPVAADHDAVGPAYRNDCCASILIQDFLQRPSGRLCRSSYPRLGWRWKNQYSRRVSRRRKPGRRNIVQAENQLGFFEPVPRVVGP